MIKRLSDLPEDRVVPGDPDIRGWPVVDVDGRPIGRIQDLLVDTDDCKVRYASLQTGDGTHLIPIGQLELHEEGRHTAVRSGALDPFVALDRLPVYQGEDLTSEHERAVYATFVPDGSELTYRRPEFQALSPRLRRLEERLRSRNP